MEEKQEPEGLICVVFQPKTPNCLDQHFCLIGFEGCSVWRRLAQKTASRGLIELGCAFPKLRLAFLRLRVNAEEPMSSGGNATVTAGAVGTGFSGC